MGCPSHKMDSSEGWRTVMQEGICTENKSASYIGEVLQSGTRGCGKLGFCPKRLKASCHRVLGSSEWCYKMLRTPKNDILEFLVCTQLSFISHSEPMPSAMECYSAKLFGSMLQLFLFAHSCSVPRQWLRSEKLLFHWETLIALFHKHSAMR